MKVKIAIYSSAIYQYKTNWYYRRRRLINKKHILNVSWQDNKRTWYLKKQQLNYDYSFVAVMHAYSVILLIST